MLKKAFLPKTRVETIIYLSKSGEYIPWEVAQGRVKVKRVGRVNTIELNLNRIIEREKRLDNILKRLVDNWIRLKVLQETRIDMLNRGVKDLLTGQGERYVYMCNMTVIKASPKLLRYYTNAAITCILNGEWRVDSEEGKIYADITRLLKDWLFADTDIENLVDKAYLAAVGLDQKYEESMLYQTYSRQPKAGTETGRVQAEKSAIQEVEKPLKPNLKKQIAVRKEKFQPPVIEEEGEPVDEGPRSEEADLPPTDQESLSTSYSAHPSEQSSEAPSTSQESQDTPSHAQPSHNRTKPQLEDGPSFPGLKAHLQGPE